MNLKKQILSDFDNENHYICFHLKFNDKSLKFPFLDNVNDLLLNYVHNEINNYNIQQYEINNFFKSFAGIKTTPNYNYSYQKGSSKCVPSISYCENFKNDFFYYNKISIFAKIQVFKNYKNKIFEKYFDERYNERVKVICYKFYSETILESKIFYFIQKQKILNIEKSILGEKNLVILYDKIEPCYETGIVHESDKKSENEVEEIKSILNMKRFWGTEIYFCEQIFNYEPLLILFD
ncbi:hypothetical protein GVAV_000968 [Gurleya vavrai]